MTGYTSRNLRKRISQKLTEHARFSCKKNNKGEEKLTVRHPPGKRPVVFRCRAGRGKTRDVIPASTTESRCCSPAPTQSRSAYLLTQKIKDRLLLQHTGYTEIAGKQA